MVLSVCCVFAERAPRRVVLIVTGALVRTKKGRSPLRRENGPQRGSRAPQFVVLRRCIERWQESACRFAPPRRYGPIAQNSVSGQCGIKAADQPLHAARAGPRGSRSRFSRLSPVRNLPRVPAYDGVEIHAGFGRFTSSTSSWSVTSNKGRTDRWA